MAVVSLLSSLGCLFLGLKAANGARMTGFEKNNQLPGRSWVRRFVERHSVCLRRTVEISKGRQVLTANDLALWQQDTENYLLSNPVLAECFKDPRRLFNQDESSIELGSSSQRVLTPKGTKVIYHVSSGSREHITVSFACNAAGGMVPPRVIYKGVRNIAATQMNLPEDGLSGKWNVSVAPKGYITRPLFVEVLKDINTYVVEKDIPKPVVVILDGASPHLSIEAAAYCKANQIQPWLLRPNMTHLTQPLDLVFFADLKKTLKKSAWNWQTDPKNTGQFLNKYSVIGLLHEVTESCLRKPKLVQNGFKRAGLFPWDKTAPDRSKLLPGTVFSAIQAEQVLDIPPALEPLLADQQDAVEYDLDSLPPAVVPEQHNLQPDVEFELDYQLPAVEPEVDCRPPALEQEQDTLQLFPLFDDQLFLPAHESSSVHENEEEPANDNSDFEPMTSSTFNSESLTNKTFLCGSCDRRVLERFRALHLEKCFSVEQRDDDPLVPDQVPDQEPLQRDDANKENLPLPSSLSSVPTFTLEDRATMLNKFEVLLLNPKQVLEFNSQYELRNFVHTEPLFSAWLTLKLATIPTEKEALDKVLKSHEASNVPKKKTNRKQNVPSGPTRFDPSSQDWISILEESGQNAANKKKTIPKKKVQQKPKQKPQQKATKKSIRN